MSRTPAHVPTTKEVRAIARLRSKLRREPGVDGVVEESLRFIHRPYRNGRTSSCIIVRSF
ncbi:MAG: hypothetical protein ACREIA_17855 [Opitutaceae bacterium]